MIVVSEVMCHRLMDKGACNGHSQPCPVYNNACVPVISVIMILFVPPL